MILPIRNHPSYSLTWPRSRLHCEQHRKGRIIQPKHFRSPFQSLGHTPFDLGGHRWVSNLKFWIACVDKHVTKKSNLNTWHSLTCASWTGTPHRLRGLSARLMEGCSHNSAASKMSLPSSLYRRAAWTRSSRWSSCFLGDGRAGSSWTRRGLRRSPWGGCPTAESWSPPRLESSLSTACCNRWTLAISD